MHIYSYKKQVNRKQNLDFLIDRSFPGVNRYFVLSFENDDDWESHIQYYLPTVEIKDYNVMIDGQNFLLQPIKHELKTNDINKNIATNPGDDYTAGFFLDYPYFKYTTK